MGADVSLGWFDRAGAEVELVETVDETGVLAT